ncbi:MAG: hypothetical protein NZ895_00495 [Archaeoglobaceae archaeon]|nr:hypothetical protein [Archaeoglobaceae archaeon]MCX8151897.1 hypothetical protein [Archaeoglobaceae archaeon]MDW8013286.1 PUA domain-containing protein [Archaeoglobaceae archaeon]
MRKPNKRERKVINSALNFFGSSENDLVLFLKDKELYAFSKDLAEFLEKRKLPCIAGIKVGEVGSRRLRLTLEGTYWLVKNEKKRVFVNEKGEMLFLYGRDIFAGSVEKCSEFDENEIVFVCNRFGDIIGLGKSRYPSRKLSEIEKDKVFVENLVDRGEYIRRKKLYNSY